MRGDGFVTQALCEVVRDPLGEAACIHKDERRAMLLHELR
jgi:hypothetical protein